MGGLLGHLSKEDREYLERHGSFDDHIGPLGSHSDDDEDWYSIAQAAHAENENLRKKIKVLESRIKYLEGKCRTKASG